MAFQPWGKFFFSRCHCRHTWRNLAPGCIFRSISNNTAWQAYLSSQTIQATQKAEFVVNLGFVCLISQARSGSEKSWTRRGLRRPVEFWLVRDEEVRLSFFRRGTWQFRNQKRIFLDFVLFFSMWWFAFSIYLKILFGQVKTAQGNTTLTIRAAEQPGDSNEAQIKNCWILACGMKTANLQGYLYDREFLFFFQ